MSHPIDHAWFVSARADPLLDDGIRQQRVYPSTPPAGRGPLHHDSLPHRICVYLGGNLGRERRYIDEAQALGRQTAAPVVLLSFVARFRRTFRRLVVE